MSVRIAPITVGDVECVVKVGKKRATLETLGGRLAVLTEGRLKAILRKMAAVRKRHLRA